MVCHHINKTDSTSLMLLLQQEELFENISKTKLLYRETVNLNFYIIKYIFNEKRGQNSGDKH